VKKIAILVIAATNQPVYIHYIKTYWTALIRYLAETRPHIDVYLLFENDTNIRPFAELRPHIIQDPRSDLSTLCDPKFHNPIIPGILSKTLHAFALLQDQYDVFFRTNLSSIIRVPYFDRLVQDKPDIRYSGGYVWTDCLRETLVINGRIGPGRRINNVSELDSYPGNTFISGCGYLISAAEVKTLVQRRRVFCYELADDVSVGLMLSDHEFLPGFVFEARPEQSNVEIICQIRNSQAPHIRLNHFPLEKARSLWKHLENGQIWKTESPGDRGKPPYRIHFPLFDHGEARSNEMRMTHEGLKSHPRVTLTDDPKTADYLVLCQNHLAGHNPFHSQFIAMKDQQKSKTIMMDFGDDPHSIFDRNDFRWALYFKRSHVDRPAMKDVNYGKLPIIPTAYGVIDAMVEPPADHNENRQIALSCLFEDAVCSYEIFTQGRGRLLEFAKGLAARYDYPMQIGPVSDCGPEGRQVINDTYKRCLYNSKIVLTANPDRWEGDSRTWEAICSGALVFVDRMCQPIPHALIDGEHVVFYDLSTEGFEELERKIVYYLEHDEERAQIGQQGRAFALQHHRSINRIDEMIWHLESRAADKVELTLIEEEERLTGERLRDAKVRSAWGTPEFLNSE